MSGARRYLAPAVVILVLLGAWELAARWDWISNALNIEDFLVPAPSDIARSLWEDRSLLTSNAWVTLREVLLGFLIAAVAGVGFALLIHLSDTARRAVYPLLVASQTIPIVILAPILVVWFGFGLTPKLVIVALICFFPITVNMLDGLRSVDPDLTKMMRSLGAGRLQRLWRAEIPTALPYGFSGARVAITVSVIGAVFAEYVGSSEGLGHLINQAQAQLLTARSFAAVVVLSAMAIVLFALISLLERRVITWDSREVTRR
jgi:putative hydroxymethylpyrimidine transport system permease protein